MKSATAYYLILLYAVAVCKPFLPLVSDFLAHTFQSEAHLETVHKTHGGNHVHDELNKAAKDEDGKVAGSTVSEPVAVHVITQNGFSLPSVSISIKHSLIASPAALTSFLEKHSPPPKV